ncbi:MAG TPA: hypothetical protein VG101_11275 [Puia sp.]|jgi:hypothetical protein|nr:hypothetical protein [Puia sp.]
MNALPIIKPILPFLFSVLLGSGHSAGTAEVKYIPVSETQGVFNVVYNNEAGSRFLLQIEDQDGNQLYQNIFTDKLFNRNFQLAEPENYTRLVFLIRNLGDHSSQRFQVETNTHLVEDVNVQEIK